MIPFNKIPFSDFDVDQIQGENIVQEIKQRLELYPDKSLDIQTIANVSNATGLEVKKVFYYLLYQDFLKPTYIPYHVRCGCAVDTMKPSVNDIILDDYLDFLCAHCPEPIEDIEEIEIRILFWGRHG